VLPSHGEGGAFGFTEIVNLSMRLRQEEQHRIVGFLSKGGEERKGKERKGKMKEDLANPQPVKLADMGEAQVY